MYIEQRRRLWWAFHDIPKKLQKVLGRGTKFRAALGTEHKATATRRATIIYAGWLAEIEKARSQTSDHVEEAAQRWRRALREAPNEEQKELVLSFIDDEADEIVQKAALRKGVVDQRDPAYSELPELEQANRFYAIATGIEIKFEEHLEEWLATKHDEPKSKDMKRSTAKKFAAEFPYVHDVKRKLVQSWINRLAQDGKKPATIRRQLGELRGYWSYLMSIEVVSEDKLPFDRLSVPRPPKKVNQEDERKPFEPEDVVRLLRAAEAKKDNALAALIKLGMWTGARIEELCSLKVKSVGADYFDVEDSKSPAGRRRVPIHSRLAATVRALVEKSKDGYVLSGLTENKYGDRSNAIGKRFGRLKADTGYGPEHVFHSVRKTVATLLENAGVPEGVAADIIGHDKPTLTYGVYSGGASLTVKRQALEKLEYPWALTLAQV